MTPLLLTTAELTSWLGGFFWPLVRISAMFILTPVIGARFVPIRIRMAIAVIITLIIVPTLGPAPAVEPWSADGVLITAKQLLIGIGMGLLLQFIFGAVTLAGMSISTSMGLGMAMMTDPQNGANVPVIGQFLTTLASLLFLVFDGHLALIELISVSFSYMPIGTRGPGPEGFQLIIDASSIIFMAAISLALPAMMTLLSINILLGVMTRVSPQMNIFSVGLPLTLFVGLVILTVTLPVLAPTFERLMQESFVSIRGYVGVP
jgi:flagellar biosynthetic protein FliR